MKKTDLVQAQNRVFINHRFKFSVSELFKWLVQPDLIAKWFGPQHLSVEAVQADVRVGGKYVIELRRPDQKKFFIEGEYIEVVEPYTLVFTFKYRGLPILPPDSIVKIKLESVAQNEAMLFLVQDFKFEPKDKERKIESWEHMLRLLEEQISTTEQS